MRASGRKIKCSSKGDGCAVKVAHVSTFLPMRCGIAVYISDLMEALPGIEHRKYELHYGTSGTVGAAGQADVSDPMAIRELAYNIAHSDCDVVNLQHEFGIWGGKFGEDSRGITDEIPFPVAATLHTTFTKESRPEIQASILQRIVEQSFATVVLTRKSRSTLANLLHVPEDTISVIPHGIPDIPFAPPRSIQPSSAADKPALNLLSFGFFRPDKGLEEVIRAVQILKTSGYDCSYVIAGSPQPQFVDQEQYYRRIHQLITDIGLMDSVYLNCRFLTRSEQIKLIQDSHVGIFAYQDPLHASSGAVSLTLAAGRPVICTPFEFALATRMEVDGVRVARDFGALAIAECLTDLLSMRMDYGEHVARVHEQTRQRTWGSVARAYDALLASACAS